MIIRLRGAMITVAFLWVTATIPELTRAVESAASDCPSRQVTFDGVQPLEYANIKAETTNNVAFYHDYPRLCAPNDTESCQTKAYLLDGDEVAIGTVCDQWAFVQYIGEKRVSLGWIAAGNLMRVDLPVAPVPHLPSGEYPGTSHFRTTLFKGKGVPVCEAYLQRMNQTPFQFPPFCGRPENTSVPGFALLNRVWVPTGDINRVQIDAVPFIFDQSLPSTLGRSPFPLDGHLLTYRYEPGIAIENDGVSRDVWMWNLDSRDQQNCGRWFGPNPYLHRSNQVPIILTEGGLSLDRDATRSAFGQPLSGPPLPGGAHQVRHYAGYAPLGYTYGIFEYRGVYYFDTFFDNGPSFGDIYDTPDADSAVNRLGVFVRHQKQTTEVCELKVQQYNQGAE